MKNIWLLEDAISFVRKIQPKALINGYAICIGGGVLNAGFSWKDLDLVAMPACNEDQDQDAFLEAFLNEGFTVNNILDNFPGIKVFKLNNGKVNIDLIIPILSPYTPKEEKLVAEEVYNKLNPKIYLEEDNYS